MNTWIIEHLAEILFGLISAGCLAFCKYLWSQNKKLKDYDDEKKTRQIRNMIVDEIEPLAKELSDIRTEVRKNKKEAEQQLKVFNTKADATHEEMYRYLEELQEGNIHNFNAILNSYKFRLIQLCKTHLTDGFISVADYEQLSEFYKLYHDLGGNGQAKEMYDLTIKLPQKN